MSRHTQYDERASILLNQILATCYEISTLTKADAFFSYSPHTSEINIIIHPNGWSDEDDWEENGGDIFYVNNCHIYFGDSEPDEGDFENDEYYKMGIEPLQKTYEQLEALKKQYIGEANDEKD